MLTPSTGCRLGTICIELEPFPITPTRLFRKSYLDLVSSHCPAKQDARSLGGGGYMNVAYIPHIRLVIVYNMSICVYVGDGVGVGV